MRRVAWLLAGLAALLAALAAGGAYLGGTAAGFRWLLAAASEMSGGRVRVEGVDGHLGVPLDIAKLTITTDTQRIEIAGIRLAWQPRALWQRRLDVDVLAARSMQVTILKKDVAPPELPRSLRLPVAVRVRALDLARLDVVDAGRTLTLGPLRGRLDDDGERYRLTGARATTPWAELEGEFALAKDAPFALRGRVDAARRAPVPVAARLDLTGSLARVAFRLGASAEGMGMLASGEAAPFARVRLRRILVAGQGIDPRLFAADAPRADLAFSGIFEGQPGERLLGTFSLSNRLAGRLDQHRLPLADLSGAVLGDSARADFSALAIDLGAAGRLSGSGQWRDGRFAIDLSAPRLNLAGLHGDLYATALQTTLRLTGDATRQTLDATLGESWGQGRFRLTHADRTLRLEAADFSGQGGRLAAEGMLERGARRAFFVAFDAAQVDPSRFGKFPRARLNARGEARGELAPEFRLYTRFTLPPGELEGRPVAGQGQLRYAGRRLSEVAVDLDLAGNRVRAKGAYGGAGDRLGWDIDAPALARLNLGLAGRLTSSGSASGDPGRPQIDGVLDASGLRLPGAYAADALSVRLNLQAAAGGAFEGQLDARGVTVAGRRLSFVRAAAQGRRESHQLTLDARMPDWRLTAALAGGLDAARVWRGQLMQAEVQGPWPIELAAPAAVLLSRTRQQADHLALTLAGGRLLLEQTSFQDGQLATRGTLSNLPLAPLFALLETAPPFTTDLRVDGDWDLRVGDSIDGTARLRRQAGDVRLVEPALNLGVTALALDVNAEAGRVTAAIEAAGREIGALRAEGRATPLREAAGFTLPRSAPLEWTAQLELPDLRLARAFLPVGMRADARVHARLAGSGSLAAPRLDGRIAADAIRFAMPEHGVTITDGSLQFILAGDRVRVQQGELKGESGRIAVSGEAEFRNPQAGLALDFERFSVSNRSDRRVIMTGTTRLNLDPKRLQLTGDLRADRARIEKPDAGRPELSSDVVVVGRPQREKAARPRLPLALDLRFELGKDFLFKGAGFDARLGGQLRVFTVNEVLRGEGSIRVEEGRYAAYAQSLVIERGVLTFSGPIDNPGLDVLAVRKTPTVKAGVQVRGTAQRPQVTLYSDPPLPETEKLAWLVMGHGLDKGGQQEFAMLQLAAGALLSQTESLNFQAQLAEALRIDSFEVRAGEGEDLSSTVVSVGKRLSSRATLSYEQGLDGLNQVVKVLYQLSPRVRLEAQAGQQSSFDAFYSLEYD